MTTKTKMKKKASTETKTKIKTKPKIKNKMRTKTKIRIKMKSFCVFVNSMWSRGVIDGQLSLTWPRSAIVFSFANFTRGLAVP